MSRFGSVEAGAPIEVFALIKAFNEDSFPDKVNLSVGGKSTFFIATYFYAKELE